MPIHTNIDEQYLQTSPFKIDTYLGITITKKSKRSYTAKLAEKDRAT